MDGLCWTATLFYLHRSSRASPPSERCTPTVFVFNERPGPADGSIGFVLQDFDLIGPARAIPQVRHTKL